MRAVSTRSAFPWQRPLVSRVIRTELIRGSAVLTGIAAAVALGYAVFAGIPAWGGSWLSLGVTLRSALQIAGPVVVAGAVWAAGRERRRGMGELLGSTARSPWQRIVLSWGSITLAAIVALAGVWGAAAVLVAPVASYHGGIIWHPLVAAVSIGMLVALGTAVGRFVPWRGAAPVTAIVALYTLAYLGSGQKNDGLMWLSPSLPNWPGQTLNLPASGALLEVLWFAALTWVLLVLAGARRRSWALVPALIAICAAGPLVHGPGQDRWPPTGTATREVCRGDVPRVCVTQASAYLLDDLVVQVDQLWPQLKGVEGAPQTFREAAQVNPLPDAQTVYVSSLSSDLHGRLEWGLLEAENLVSGVVAVQCDPGTVADDDAWFQDQAAAAAAAGMLISGRSSTLFGLPAGPEQTRLQLSSTLDKLPAAERRTWLGRYLTAVRSTGPCDTAALNALLDVS